MLGAFCTLRVRKTRFFDKFVSMTVTFMFVTIATQCRQAMPKCVDGVNLTGSDDGVCRQGSSEKV